MGELSDGLAASLDLGDETVDLDPNADRVEVPIGPLLVFGTLDEWNALVVRERAEPTRDAPVRSSEPLPRVGDLRPFPVVDSD